MEYQNQPIKFRHYGRYIELMIAKVATMQDGDEKDFLISLIANHMKKIMFSVNKDGVENEKIYKDLFEYSKGKINLDPSIYHLHEFKEASNPSSTKKKKKK